MTTVKVGNNTEAAVLHALAERGLHVSVPFGGGHPYDLVVEVSPAEFLRVQCKTAWERRGCLLFNAYATDHGRGPASYRGRADLFGIHFPPLDSIYLVPVDAIPSGGGRLRLEPTRNNQRRRVRLAAEYAVEMWTDEMLAGLARLPGRDQAPTVVEPPPS